MKAFCPQFSADKHTCPRRKLIARRIASSSEPKCRPAAVLVHSCQHGSASTQHSSASNRQSKFEDTSHEQFYVTLAPPHPWCCPVSYWLKMNTQIIFSLPGLCFVSRCCTRGQTLSQEKKIIVIASLHFSKTVLQSALQ